MGATSRSRRIRETKGHFELYLKGNGVDIGCGSDILQIPDGSVLPWDLPQGDAMALSGISNDSLDFVYSSHSLEHMHHPRLAIRRWTEVLKPGGILFTVVPDFRLYEHMRWPSPFNPGHNWSFSLDVTRTQAGRGSHYHVATDVVPILVEHGVTLLDARIEDDGYDYGIEFSDQTGGDKALAQICIIARKLPIGAWV